MFSITNYLNGTEVASYRYFGAHFQDNGVIFRLYAPGAKSVSLIGDFNNWDNRSHILSKDQYGVFSIFVEGLTEYTMYKYQITKKNNQVVDKIDPYAFFSELRPNCASKIFDVNSYVWHDQDYQNKKSKNYDKPLSIYEMHLGSWRRKDDNSFYSYEELAPLLIEYIQEMGFTHVEFLPLFEYPFDGSWGYQAFGFFSLTSRYGNPRQLCYLIDQLHQHNIGVIFDFVPVHFVQDIEGLIDYDGASLFEYKSKNLKFSQWGSVNFDLGKGSVVSFLTSAAAFLADCFHVDGIRVDAVSNIIYYDGNSQRGINHSGLSFIKSFNHLLASNFPALMLIAEDSSSFPHVTKPTFDNGLGFDYKWDLGWMNDSLKYLKYDPIFRKHHHSLITFSMHYFYNERFLLPLSHDEVVHMKGSIVNKMSGSYQMKFDSVKALYVYQYAHPGKKLLFMGNELGEFDEWNENKSINFHLTKFDKHLGLQRLIKDLNKVYTYHLAMFKNDYDFNCFRWIKVDNAEQSLFVFYRFYQASKLIFIFNFTPNYYPHYRFGVPWPGKYVEIINSDKEIYGGYNNYNGEVLVTKKEKNDNQNHTIGIRIAPLSGIILKLEELEEENV